MISELTSSGPRIITPDSYNDDRKVPAALHLPQGKFFFGYTYVPFDPSKVVKKPVDILPSQPFGGQGTSLKSQTTTGESSTASASASGSGSQSQAQDNKPATEAPVDPWAKLGSGNTLSNVKKEPAKPVKTEAEQRQEVIDATMLDEDEFWGDEGMEDDDDDDGDEEIIEIDSD